VVGVSDGDTITVLDAWKTQHKIRLAQIDAPEKDQPWGTRSKQSLSDLVFGKIVRVSITNKDRYGRKIGTVFINNRDVCEHQVRMGYAWVYAAYARDAHLFSAQHVAQKNKAGLWADGEAVEPWLWRRKVKNKLK